MKLTMREVNLMINNNIYLFGKFLDKEIDRVEIKLPDNEEVGVDRTIVFQHGTEENGIVQFITGNESPVTRKIRIKVREEELHVKLASKPDLAEALIQRELGDIMLESSFNEMVDDPEVNKQVRPFTSNKRIDVYLLTSTQEENGRLSIILLSLYIQGSYWIDRPMEVK